MAMNTNSIRGVRHLLLSTNLNRDSRMFYLISFHDDFPGEIRIHSTRFIYKQMEKGSMYFFREIILSCLKKNTIVIGS